MSEGTPSTAKEGAEEGMETLSGYRGSTGVCLGNHQAQPRRRGWTHPPYRQSARSGAQGGVRWSNPSDRPPPAWTGRRRPVGNPTSDMTGRRRPRPPSRGCLELARLFEA